MNERMLKYTLKEAEMGIRMMARDKSPLHFFDWGTDTAGTEHVFVMAIMPKELVASLEAGMKPTEPLLVGRSTPHEATLPTEAN
jgi:hypothetical protein